MFINICRFWSNVKPYMVSELRFSKFKFYMVSELRISKLYMISDL